MTLAHTGSIQTESAQIAGEKWREFSVRGLTVGACSHNAFEFIDADPRSIFGSYFLWLTRSAA
jgi:hypothetical protein